MLAIDDTLANPLRNRERFNEIVHTLAGYGLVDRVRGWNPEFVKHQVRAAAGPAVAEIACCAPSAAPEV